MAGIHDIDVVTLDGRTTTLGEWAGKVLLIVNVASKCGFTPQYAALEAVYEKYADAGLVVMGFPCNQFLFQEPGSSDQIAEFCSTTYGVSFPMFEKVKVRGRGQHPLFAAVTRIADGSGKAGGVKWNFEKFLVRRDGAPVARFRSKTTPDDPAVLSAIEQALASAA
jgi:glutathione peroxidase